jgi:serine/threonine protein kinase
MEQARWTEIERILRSTLDQPAAARQEFLRHACAGNLSLQQEVQSFLDSHDATDGFLEVPGLTVAARALAAEKQMVVGSMVGPYRIVRAIGAGGMGEVFLAQDTRLRRQIALKILPMEFAADSQRVLRFEQEARAASALDHPNVLIIHDAGVHNGIPYIASEFLQSETLRDRLNRGKIPLTKALDYAQQMARALAAAHDSGIIHRDLKPENLFITVEGRLKILDFFVAKLIEPSPDQTSTLTVPGVVIGTAGYLSPEQVRGQTAVPSSDLFSFGCVLLEMLTGQRAFSKDSAAETMTAILREEPAGSESLQTLPPALVRTVRHCLEKSPTERFNPPATWRLP